MKKVIIFGAFASMSALAGAQTQPEPVDRTPIMQNMVKDVVSPSHCLYDGKPFTEGAVKTFDGVRQICMERDSLRANPGGAPRELVWESENSFRGKTAIGRHPAAAKKSVPGL